MPWFGRKKTAERPHVSAGERLAHLEKFIQSRYGVEAYLEPRTTVTETTVLLVAHDGEWTRRRVADPQAARRFAHQQGVPLYDVTLVGYPQRMRDYNERRKRRPEEFGPAPR
ncbi:hypothetical protein [Pilimelia columellifera]